MDSYGLASKITSLPGKRDELAEALMQVPRLVFLSDGCLSYVVSKIDSEENGLFVTRFWKSEEARRSVLSMPGHFELLGRFHDLMADAEETVLRPLTH